MKPPFFLRAIILAALVTACGRATATPTPAPVMTEESPGSVAGMAVVQSVDIQILESQPIQVNALIRG